MLIQNCSPAQCRGQSGCLGMSGGGAAGSLSQEDGTGRAGGRKGLTERRLVEDMGKEPGKQEARVAGQSRGGGRVSGHGPLSSEDTCDAQAFRADLSAWCIGPMHAVVHNARSVATAADEELRRTGKKASKVLPSSKPAARCPPGRSPLRSLRRTVSVVLLTPAKQKPLCRVQLNDAGSLLQKCFSAALQGHGNKAKKLATLEARPPPLMRPTSSQSLGNA